MALEFAIPAFCIPNSNPTPATEDEIVDCISNNSPNGKFKVNCRRFIITYKTWLDKYAITQHFVEMGAVQVRVAHEVGTKKIDYEHSHVYADFGKFICRSDPRCFDFNGIHPNIGPINKQKHLNRIYKYMCKYDKDNLDMLNWIVNAGDVQDIWDCHTLVDAVKGVKLSEVMGAIAAYALKPQAEWPIKEWEFQWQADLEDKMVSQYPPKRNIFWFMDNRGGMGKTDFALGMMDRHPKDTYVFTQFGGARDTATVICNALDAGWTGKYCIVDLPRDAQTKAIYEPMESIKNGLITSIKYQGLTKRWKSGWLIVMANFGPEGGHMSCDRWVIADMNEDKYFKTKLNEITPTSEGPKELSLYDHQSNIRNKTGIIEEVVSDPVDNLTWKQPEDMDLTPVIGNVLKNGMEKWNSPAWVNEMSRSEYKALRKIPESSKAEVNRTIESYIRANNEMIGHLGNGSNPKWTV